MLGRNLSSKPWADGETLASPGDPVTRLALVVLELDFCLFERAGTRATLNETAGMDETEQPSCRPAGAGTRRLVFVRSSSDAGEGETTALRVDRCSSRVTAVLG